MEILSRSHNLKKEKKKKKDPTQYQSTDPTYSRTFELGRVIPDKPDYYRDGLRVAVKLTRSQSL